MEEGREGARTKGLQKPNPWYRGRLTTPRNHPYTLCKEWATWHMWVCRCALGSSLNFGVVCRMDIIQENKTFLRPDKNCVHFRLPNRKAQLNTNHPRVLKPKFLTTASDRKVAKKCKNMPWYFHVNTTNGQPPLSLRLSTSQNKWSVLDSQCLETRQ